MNAKTLGWKDDAQSLKRLEEAMFDRSMKNEKQNRTVGKTGEEGSQNAVS